MKKIGFVIPWYAKNIPGGAEAALRGIVKHLQAAGVELEVLTTCIKEFNSDWNTDYYPQGIEMIDGITVRRFPVRKRDTAAFDAINYKLMNRLPITSAEEKIFIREMANSPKLYDYIRDNQEAYELFVYIPYMFGTTYYGIEACPQKSVLIPCFHDESYVYLHIYKEVFSKLKGIIFLAKPEQELANRVFDLKEVQQAVLGTGIDMEYNGCGENFKKKYRIVDPFILYAGRKDEGKNINTLIQYFAEYKKRNQTKLKLLLIGGGHVNIPSKMKTEILDLGFLSIQDKADAYAAAEFLCQPSKNESFSLVIMESWLNLRPVLVHGGCAVTRNFAVEAQAGLYFENYYEFEGCVNYLLEHPDTAKQMGINGNQYVRENFTWDAIVRKYTEFLALCAKLV